MAFLEQVLEVGQHKLTCRKKPEFQDGKPVQGSHQKKVAKNGNPYWLYSTKVGDQWVTFSAWNEEEKNWCDNGEITVEVRQMARGRKASILPPEYNMQPNTNDMTSSAPLPSPPPDMQIDNTQERILRGMCFNNACTILSQQGVQPPGAVKDMAKSLYSEMKDWLQGKDDDNGIEF